MLFSKLLFDSYKISNSHGIFMSRDRLPTILHVTYLLSGRQEHGEELRHKSHLVSSVELVQAAVKKELKRHCFL